MNNYILLGGVQSILPVLRSLSLEGAIVHLVCDKSDVASRSKFGVKYFISESNLVDDIIRSILDELSDEVVIIVGSEAYVKYIPYFYNHDKVSIFSMRPEDIERFSDKFQAYEVANNRGVGVLPSYSLASDSFKDLNFPAIIKWAMHCDSNNLPKTKIVKNLDDLLEYKSRVSERYYTKLIIQPCLNNYRSFSFGSIWKTGQLLDSIVVEQLRQYPTGITSSVSIADESIKSLLEIEVRKLFLDVEVHGFVEVEFIYSESSFYMIDINSRIWGWSAAMTSKYEGKWTKILCNHEVFPSCEGFEFYVWINVLRDFPAIIKSKSSFREKIEMLGGYFSKGTKLQAFNFRDPVPEIYGILK